MSEANLITEGLELALHQVRSVCESRADYFAAVGVAAELVERVEAAWVGHETRSTF